MSYGLDDKGYIAPRTTDFKDLIRSKIEQSYAANGWPLPLWESDEVLTNLVDVMASALGTVAEGTQQVFDSRDVNNARGLNLDNLMELADIQRDEATHSTATCTFTGTAGTNIPFGTLVRSDDGDLWETTEVLVIGGGGTVDGLVQAVETGPIQADAGEISQVVTPVDGLSSVVSILDANLGDDEESDESLLVRRRRDLAIGTQGLSAAKIAKAVLELDFITDAVVFENNSLNTATVQGQSMPGRSWALVVLPAVLTADQQQEVADTAAQFAPAGGESVGDNTSYIIDSGSDVPVALNWSYGSQFEVSVQVNATVETGYSLIDITSGIEDTLQDYFNTLSLGDDVNLLQICGQLATIEGLGAASVTLNDVAANATVAASEQPILGTVTVT